MRSPPLPDQPSTRMQPAATGRRRIGLTGLALGVLAAHAWLLDILPTADAQPLPAPSIQVLPLSTRSLPATPLPAQHDSMPASTGAAPSIPPVPAARATVHPNSQTTANPATEISAQPALQTNDLSEVLLAAADVRSSTTQSHTPSTAQPVPSAVTQPEAAPARVTLLPESVLLKYDIRGETRGFPYTVNGEMLWKHDGATYEARLSISHFLLGSRVQSSKGQIGSFGLEPLRFGDKVRSEVAAHFDRAKTRVTFSANTPDVALQAGAQDQLSVFIQLAAMLGSDPARYPVGAGLPFQAIGPRSSEEWVFKVEGPEKLTLPGGEVTAIKLSRAAIGEFDARGEVWLAPSMGYMPARIRITQSNGDFIDQRWSSSQKP